MLRLTRAQKEALERAAEDDGRPASNYLRKVLVDHLKKRGYLEPDKAKREKGGEPEDA